ncbi:MAG: hypothetical protein A3H44_02695 [Gammaproteobacteria bacterium RIFCSPLOWO2_02_FULL_57_10]|nr:MAG: hypothetical protein A3H44_02695 [Gammaproteobacteria bacterium RIFCSPLOWO2_02_FULL_57_10]
MFALLLMLNHSLMFGVMEAAALPDEDHPFGQAVPHEHLHDHNHQVIDEHSHGHDSGEHQRAVTGSDDHSQEHHHSHGVHVQLNCDLPYSLNFNLPKPGCDALTDYHVTHQSLTYAPPVPPPNR